MPKFAYLICLLLVFSIGVVYPNNLKHWNFGAKVTGLTDHKRLHISNIGSFTIGQSRILSRQPKSNSSDCLGIASPVLNVRRMQAFLLIGDTHSAVQEAHVALENYPDEPLIHDWAIRSLAAQGEEEEMMQLWEQLHKNFPETALKQELLEEICWGILNKGKATSSVDSRLICLIAAALTQDMRAVPFLIEGIRNTNTQIRTVAVELAALYRDFSLKNEVKRLFYEEVNLDVRIAILKAIGKLELDSLLPDLIRSIANPNVGEKETSAIIEAIVQMGYQVEKEDLKALATSHWPGLRQLACEVIMTYDLKEEHVLLLPLMQDVKPEVCAAALKAWAFLRQPLIPTIPYLALNALDPLVGITAAWVWLINEPEQAEPAFLKWLAHGNPHVRALSAAAIAYSGSRGVPLAKKYLHSSDPYVQLNLAMGLAWQREEIEAVCIIIKKISESCSDRWMRLEKGNFKPIEKSTLTHNPVIPNYPEIMNQTIRLELLNLLAILESSEALEALKNFLKTKKWGVTGIAAETLLGEGDENSIELVHELLKDQNQEICLEAALILASWGRDPSAIQTLLKIYPKVDWQSQLKILEALGHVANKSILPFLIERLKEPSLMLRMVAACVLIQVLNN